MKVLDRIGRRINRIPDWFCAACSIAALVIAIISIVINWLSLSLWEGL